MRKCNLLCSLLLCITTAAMAREGVYAEYKVSSASVQGNNKTWVSDGDIRSEVAVRGPMAPGATNVVTLLLHNEADKMYMLSEKDKTYMVMTTGKISPMHDDNDDYDVAVVGKETVNGYNSTHVRVTNKRTQHASDLWLSKDVKGYENFTGVKTQYFGGKGFYSKLKDKGAEGFVVRMQTKTEGDEMKIDLVKVEKKDMPDELFSLNGYTKGASYDMSKLAEDMKKMTPEERKAYMEQMAKQYGR